MSKSKTTTPKKQPPKTPVKPPIDLDKAERMIDKMIADGSFAKQADKLAQQMNDRLEAIRANDERLAEQVKTEEEKDYEERLALEKKAYSAIDEYITIAKTAYELPDIVCGFLDYEIVNLENYPTEIGKIMHCLNKPDLSEALKKNFSFGTFSFLTELLSRVISFTTSLQADNLSLARLERVMLENGGQDKKEILIMISKYKTMAEHTAAVKIIESDPQNP